eukprot:TRINITY_DN75583_c0_g1_i1.p1 TRINITY_DN75583_c0_g1~~TRINITY_DN75583_c0_g1_i1.p1  ORF type:complete len:378 (+),score=29.31 TRINITY_DN75583_c0_g1_i1:32-1165(+)
MMIRRQTPTRRRLSILRRAAADRRQRASAICCSRSSSGLQAKAAQVPPLSQQREPLCVPVPEGQYEACREAVGLRLIGGPVVSQEDSSALGATLACGTWEYPLMDEHRRCFAGVLRGAVPESKRAELWEKVFSGTPWEQPMQTWGPMPRKTAWMSDSPCSCKYGYGGMQIAPIPFPPWMHDIMEMLMPLCGLRDRSEWPNSCNLNLYENQDHSVSWHADNEKLFNGKFQDCPIISLSLGQERCFEFKAPGIPEDSQKFNHQLQLRDGDLCTMEGMFQKYYQHRVPRTDKQVKARINITWRWLVEHFFECPLRSSEKRIMPYGGGKGGPPSKGDNKGKGKGKGKDQMKGKSKGKGKDQSKGKGHGSGRGLVRPTIRKY